MSLYGPGQSRSLTKSSCIFQIMKPEESYTILFDAICFTLYNGESDVDERYIERWLIRQSREPGYLTLDFVKFDKFRRQKVEQGSTRFRYVGDEYNLNTNIDTIIPKFLEEVKQYNFNLNDYLKPDVYAQESAPCLLFKSQILKKCYQVFESDLKIVDHLNSLERSPSKT
jgi:hypothetical protein